MSPASPLAPNPFLASQCSLSPSFILYLWETQISPPNVYFWVIIYNRSAISLYPLSPSPSWGRKGWAPPCLINSTVNLSVDLDDGGKGGGEASHLQE